MLTTFFLAENAETVFSGSLINVYCLYLEPESETSIRINETLIKCDTFSEELKHEYLTSYSLQILKVLVQNYEAGEIKMI